MSGKQYKFILLMISITLMMVSSSILSGQEDLVTFQNHRIYPSQVTQTEVFITSSPENENLFFCSCNTLTFIPFFVSEGVYVSTDAGNTWSGQDYCNGQFIDFHGGDPGIAIDINGRFIITRLGRTPFTGLYSHFSYDNGNTWTAQTSISNDDLERASVSTDKSQESNFSGNTYATWVKFSNPFPVMFSKVLLSSQSWSQPVSINSPDSRCAGGDVAVGPYGDVNVCWAGVSDQSPFREIYAGYARSSNGGETWSVNENIFQMNGITGLLPEKGNIRVNGLPGIAVDNSNGSRRGWIYIVTGQKDLFPAGSDPDIILYKSVDNGSTWSDGIRVNQDQVNNGKVQYFPAIHIDEYGGINIIYYDDRNTTSDSIGVFLSRSIDGGVTFNDYQISDHNFKPEPIGGLGQGYQGDNIDLTSTSEKLIPVWMDNSTGLYQIWSTEIRFGDIDFLESLGHVSGFDFKIYPNPADETAFIKIESDVGGRLKVRLTDISNTISFDNIDIHINAGVYTQKIDIAKHDAVSGIFFISAELNGEEVTKKLVINEY